MFVVKKKKKKGVISFGKMTNLTHWTPKAKIFRRCEGQCLLYMPFVQNMMCKTYITDRYAMGAFHSKWRIVITDFTR